MSGAPRSECDRDVTIMLCRRATRFLTREETAANAMFTVDTSRIWPRFGSFAAMTRCVESTQRKAAETHAGRFPGSVLLGRACHEPYRNASHGLRYGHRSLS